MAAIGSALDRVVGYANMAGSSSLNITDATTGVSKQGMQKYIDDINAKVITETIKLLDETGDIADAVHKSWSGESAEKFLMAFADSISRIKEDLKNEEQNLLSKLQALQFSYIQQDRMMAEDIASQF